DNQEEKAEAGGSDQGGQDHWCFLSGSGRQRRLGQWRSGRRSRARRRRRARRQSFTCGHQPQRDALDRDGLGAAPEFGLRARALTLRSAWRARGRCLLASEERSKGTSPVGHAAGEQQDGATKGSRFEQSAGFSHREVSTISRNTLQSEDKNGKAPESLANRSV